MNDVNNLGIRNLLFNIINQKDLSSIDYNIAYYLLNQFNDLDKLNIYRMVDECNVSRSSINRFIKELGYKNFLDFKNGFKNQRYIIQKENLIDRPYGDYISILTDNIFNMMKELRERMNTDEVIKICENIHFSKNVVFLSSSTNAGMVTYFQQEFIFMNKLIQSVSDSYSKHNFMSQLDYNDLIIVFSVSGRFAKACEEYVSNARSKKILITANRSNEISNNYNKVYHLSSKDINNVDINIYNRYGITYMLDIILNTYSFLYFNKEKEK